jgi:membrane protein
MTVGDYTGRAWRFIMTLRREFARDNASMVAAAMSFYALLSMVPLLIIAVAALGYVLRSPEQAYSRVFDYVGQFSPGLAREQGQGIKELLQGIVGGRKIAGWLGLITLLWTGSQIFVSLEQAINIAWDVNARRGFIRTRLFAILMVMSAGVLLLVTLGLTALVQIVLGLHVEVLGVSLGHLWWLWRVVGVLLPLVITVCMFTLVYKLLPNRAVRLRDALTGAVVAGLLWEVAKQTFSWYVPRFAHFNKVYGSLGGVIILIVWVYYSSMVTVIGAEVSAIKAKVKNGA